MQIYYYEPNDAIFMATAEKMKTESIDAQRIQEDFFQQDLSLLDKGGNETRAVVISHGEDTAQTNDFIKSIRNSSCRNPILVIRNFRSSSETAEMINNGADDVLIRPFKNIEITARINCINRRSHGHVGPSVMIGDIVAFLDGRDPEVAGERMELTQREHTIFSHLALHHGRVITKNSLFDSCYGMSDSTPFDKVIDVYICKLRKKIETFTGRPGQDYIETVYGRGYMLTAPDDNVKPKNIEGIAAEIKSGINSAEFAGELAK
jgi:two-component system cell cycle response regulator CtrA